MKKCKCGNNIVNKSKTCQICYYKILKGKSNPNFKGGLPNCKICGKKLSRRECTYCVQHAQVDYDRTGKNNPMYGQIPKYYKYEYKNNKMRSSYEVNFAIWLDGSGIKWSYEPQSFKINKTNYTPDFYLPEFDYYIEIKGWLREKDIRKMEIFKKKYNLKLLLESDLKEMSIL